MPASTSCRTARRRCSRMRHAGLELLPRVFVHRRHADVHAARRPRRQILENVRVAHDHRALGHDADGSRRIAQRLEHAARDFVGALDRLIRIGGGAEADGLLRPGRLVELAPQHANEIGLDEDHRGEVVAHVQLELGLIAAREAVVAAVCAAAIWIERPLHEGHALTAIERRAAVDFLVGRGIAAASGVRQSGHAAVLHQPRDVAGGRGAT